ncbi:MAG: Gldg family protein [Gammaproteobacteria bacterium]
MSNRNLNLERSSLLTIAVIFLATIFLSNTLLQGLRIDLTENQLYTLSDGTRNILGDIPEPITLYFFYSDKATADIPYLRSYAERIREMLAEFEESADDKLQISIIDPLPFSEDEDRATEFGLQSINTGMTNDAVYLGLAGTNSVGDEETIAFFDPRKEAFLEYDLAKLVHTLANPKKPIIGILSSLPMTADFDPMTQQMRQAWTVSSQLQQMFDTRQLPLSTTQIEDDIDVLLVVHPKNLPMPLVYAIDQYILKGGRTMLFVDPFAEIDRPTPDPSNPAAAMMASRSSSLNQIMSAWGITVPEDEVIGDDRFALQISAPGQRPMRHIALLGVDDSGLDSADIVTNDLETINLGFSGYILRDDEAVADITPLIVSSDMADPIPAAGLALASDPDALRADFSPTGEPYILAARISGNAKTGFPDAPPGNADNHLEEAKDSINVIVVADVDLLTDRYWVQTQNFFGQQVATAFANNGDFVSNAVENMTGSSDLIGMRGRASFSRPFTRVIDLRRKAENEFRLTEERLQQQLTETEAKLQELQAERQDGSSLILTPEQTEAVHRFQDERLRIRKELRKVQRSLDEDIESLGTVLKVVNIALIPVLIATFSILLLWLRRKEQHVNSNNN